MSQQDPTPVVDLSLVLLDLLQNIDDINGNENNTAVEEELNRIVKQDFLLHCTSIPADELVYTPKFREIVKLVHQTLCLPRAKKFIKSLFNILAISENQEQQEDELLGLQTPPRDESTEAEAAAAETEQQSLRWRQLQQDQFHRVKRLRRSNHLDVNQVPTTDVATSTKIPSNLKPNLTVNTPTTPNLTATPANPTALDSSDPESQRSLIFQASPNLVAPPPVGNTPLLPLGGETDMWESQMRPSNENPFAVRLNHELAQRNNQNFTTTPAANPIAAATTTNTITTTTAPAATTTTAPPKPKSKKVPYSQHQIILPSNFFRYPLRDTLSTQEDKISSSHPTVLPSWFSIELVDQVVFDTVLRATPINLQSLLVVANSTGYYQALLETVICQGLFRNFLKHCKTHSLAYENYIGLLQKQFPAFALTALSQRDENARVLEDYLVFSDAENAFHQLPTDIQRHQWTEQSYIDHVEKFIYFRDNTNTLLLLMQEILEDLRVSVRANLRRSLFRIERVLISNLGHVDPTVRQKSVVFLNCLYDGHLWQLDHAFTPKIRCLDDYLSIEFDVELIPLVLRDKLLFSLSSPYHPATSTDPNASNQLVALKNRIVVVPKLLHGKSILLVEISRFKFAGYYDWQLGFMDPLGIEFLPFWRYIQSHTDAAHLNIENNRGNRLETQGRFIVQPSIRQDIFHEVFVDIEGAQWDRIHGGPVQVRGSFATVSKALEDYKFNDNISVIHVMGALERPEFGVGRPFAPIDRAAPNRASGGRDQFISMINNAKQKQMKVLVDATSRISRKGAHRKYRNLNCQTMSPHTGLPQVAIGTDGAEQVWEDCQLLNYRKQANWLLFITDVEQWALLGVAGIRIESSHCCPLILHPDTEELHRMDADGQFHYELQEIFDGDIVRPHTNEAFSFGYYGTRAYEDGYANPFFIRLTSTIWQRYPQFIFTAETYWNRQRNSITSGLIPFSTGLPQALTSVFGTGVGKDGHVGHFGRRDVKAFYDWYETERNSYPQNAIVIYPSSNHYSPYPVSLYGYGAWSAVDLAYFLPEIPATFVGEHAGWSMEYDWKSNSFHRSPFHGHNTLAEIRGHYVHRSQMRKSISVLRDGGMILLYAKIANQNHTWHDRVFAFARFKLQKMAIIAINFNDVESTFYIDFTPLQSLFEDQTRIYKRKDFINPTVGEVYFSLEELLHEKQQVTLQPYKSVCWGIFTEINSPAARRVLYEHSFHRLMANLDAGVDPTHNLVYSDICKAFSQSPEAFATFLKTFTEQLPPSVSNVYPRVLHHALTFYATSRGEESKLLGTLEFLRAREEANLLANSNKLIRESSTDSADSNSRRRSSSVIASNVFQKVLEHNQLGPLVFVTPEIGRFSKVGGIAVMVDELTQALAYLGCEVIVISPYYNFDRKGTTGYLKKEGVTWLQNILTFVGHERVEVGIHELKENGVTYYFIHHFDYFPTPYHAGSSIHQLKTIVLMAKAALELCCELRILPAVVITNDWFTGLVPAYGHRSTAFGTTFEGSTFFHLVHNLEEGYEGKIYLDGTDDLGYIHHLPRDIVVDPTVNQLCLNASRCALLSCNQWGTVSVSYCHDLMHGNNPSPLHHYLRRFPTPFAHSNGIQVAERKLLLSTIAKSYEDAKAQLQIKYFGEANPIVPLFSFVGRICIQKGVHLILNTARELIERYSGRIQFIIGGMANYRDPYAAQCAWSMRALRSSYPKNLWADPDEFFNDGPLLNMGSDFALMPSLFEPSGVVQQEYFLAGTPVIAFKTGGLKDTVFEGVNGNGFTFEAHAHRDFVDAISRAVAIYSDSEKYAHLRECAKSSVLDMKVVANAWATEFSRLRNCIWADNQKVAAYVKSLQKEHGDDGDVVDQFIQEQEENDEESAQESVSAVEEATD